MPLPTLSRRTFLRSAGVAIGLPLLDAMLPFGHGTEKKSAALRAKRSVFINRPLGMYMPYFVPEKAGKDYEPTRYLKHLQDHRDRFTVFSGVSHLGYAGHGSSAGLLTGVPAENIQSANEIRNTISLDQEIAGRLASDTRYSYLSLGGGDMSWNRKGMRVPSQDNAAAVFKQLFIEGTPDEVAREIQRIEMGHSILDGVRDQAKTLAKSLGAGDRQRLDLLLVSIREAELRLQKDREWVKKPKPKVAAKPFAEIGGPKMLERERQWFDLVHLALQTDSTRVITLFLHSHANVDVAGKLIGHHDMSHHGRDEMKIEQLALIEDAETKLFNDFLAKLKETTEIGESLLDQTIVFHASNLSNASAHTCDNLPVIVAGGGFKHAGHLAFDRKKNQPLSNLFVRILQQMGVETDRFGSSSGTINGI
jgi:hypothetical protein